MRNIDEKTQLCQVDKVAQVDKLQRTQNQYVVLRVQQKNEHKWGLMAKRKQVYHVEVLTVDLEKSKEDYLKIPKHSVGRVVKSFSLINNIEIYFQICFQILQL